MANSNQPAFPEARIKKMLEDRRDRIIQAVQSRLLRVGEEFVNNARNTRTYKDRTGNLRSSIGYVLLSNGVQVDSNFKAYPPGQEFRDQAGIEPGSGVEVAQEISQKIADEFPRGLVLICIAGMQYAAAVESKGFDVITSSAIIAEQSLKSGLQQIRDKVKNLSVE